MGSSRPTAARACRHGCWAQRRAFGKPGANGPVIVPFSKTGDNTFAAPDGAKLTESQFASYKAGNLYVNVHSAKNPGGEVRAQLTGN